MAVYLLAQLTFTARQAYERYQSRFMETLKGSGGRLLAADESPSVIEGTWDHEKVVLLSFPDVESCRTWFESEAYQAIAGDRRAGAKGSILLVQGL